MHLTELFAVKLSQIVSAVSPKNVLAYIVLIQWYFDENRIFPKPFSKHKQEDFMSKKNDVYCFQISLFVPEIFKFLKYANQPSDDAIHSTRFCSNMMKRDILTNLNEKCLILCSKILLNVLFNKRRFHSFMELNVIRSKNQGVKI